MKRNWKSLLLALAIPLAAGGLSALLSGGMKSFETMAKPPLSPPGWLFPVAWSILYLLMGYASWRVFFSRGDCVQIRSALTVYLVQLFFNFCWSIFFFRFGLYWFCFGWLLAMWVLILCTLVLFRRLDRTAGWLLLPYLLWVSFAGYLNFGVARLN